MAQVQKPEVRDALLRAARMASAESGWNGATLAGIARKAGVSVGNVYRYFPSKEALFAAAVPPDFGSELECLMRKRVRAMGKCVTPAELPENHPYQTASEEIFQFALRHRTLVIFLISRSAGTEHAEFPNKMTRLMSEMALHFAEETVPGFRRTASIKRALERCYRSFLVAVASVLEEEKSENSMRESLSHIDAYHMAGMHALFIQLSPACAEMERQLRENQLERGRAANRSAASSPRNLKVASQRGARRQAGLKRGSG